MTMNATSALAICWHSQRESWECPACRARGDDGKLIAWGRCRSGRRWFWAAREWHSGAADHGWAKTEEDALAAARAAAVVMAGDGSALAYPRQGVAASTLKGLNAQKRRARPPSAATSAGPVEYLYGTVHYWPDDGYGTEVRRVVPFRITRRTAKRVYYIRAQHMPEDVVTGYVDRQALERDGEVRNRGVHWCEDDAHLFATRELAEAHLGLGQETAPGPDLRQLRREMAAAHPDAGGTDEKFIAARERYERALRRVS